ncbi:acetyl-CoA C-acyltransferase [Aureispira anguillae]|uniref:acetyl-CoA C-acetyltransferase n=1 Tax=Aureispira anguillae TaxID=2864201 RepID=A0A915YC64_9BACT|nr:acetyl-CoA C-acyltransferase [Aureispira anguillae]BDS10385.1 acetyl-CoA C-acyltransferase [Aureispira anguillae]
MKEVYIVSVARTPIGNLGGVLSSVNVIDLGKTAITGAIERAGISADQIGEVYMGCVLTANTGQAPAKQVALASGIPNTVPCTTINKVCSSGMKAMMLGAQSIMLGDNDVVVVGGMESMSQAPHYIPSGRTGIRYGNGQMIDAIVRDGLQDPYDGNMMGVCGEVCAEGKNITKEEQDAYAFASYERARAAYENGWFNDEIVPVSVPQRRKDPIIVSRDEEVDNKRITDLASVQKGRAVFKKDGTVSAINASKINDGAAAVVLMSKEKVEELGLQPIAKIRSFADAAQEPVWFTTTPALAMPKAAQKAGVAIEDVDLFEINEAFSVVALANMKELGLSHDKVNVFGGAVSMGHPIGVSGCRIVVTLLSALKQKGGKIGLAGICNGGGGASAMLVELV